jgi:hypothetical protein
MGSETLYIEAQDDSPMVKHEMQGGSNVITIAGVSMPENTLDFYVPLLQQIDQIFSGSKKNKLVFHLEYMNSMSNKQIVKLISSEFKKDPELKVEWKYSKGDELIKMKGEELKSLLEGLDFSITEA